MCLIAIAPKGTDKYREMFLDGLKTSFKTNNHGCGYAVKRHADNGIFYKKGIYDIDTLINDLKALDLSKDDELIVHLRRVSSGSNNARSTHPFVLSQVDSSIDDLGPCRTFNSVFFHNGHFKDYIDDTKNFSDTYMFTKAFMRYPDIFSMVKNDKSCFEEVFKDIILDNKLAFLVAGSTNRPIITIGTFIEENKYLFSNLTYKTTKTTDTGGTASINFDKKFQEKLSDEYFSIEKGKGINTPDIKLTKDNYHDLVLESIVENTDLGIRLESKWVIYTLNENKSLQCLHSLSDNLVFCWVDMLELENNFKCRPKLSFMNKYKDYFRLKNLIQPTKTALKKINNRLKKYTKGGFPLGTDLVAIEYKNRWINDLRYDAVCMYINEYAHFINGVININVPKVEVVNAETEIQKDNIINLNENIATKLAKFRAEKAKQLESFKKVKVTGFDKLDKVIQDMEERTKLVNDAKNILENKKVLL